MAEKDAIGAVTHEHAPRTSLSSKIIPIEQLEIDQTEDHIALTWRSYLVVFVTSFAICAQVVVVTAAGSVIAFIIQDLGDPAIAGWIIQGPLLMQAVLSPVVGRLSDVLDRKYLAAVPPLVACVGAVVSATAKSMAVLVGGGILIGTTLSTIAIVQAIPSEVLPLKYRAVANGCAFLGGAVGGLIGSLGAGSLTQNGSAGWRAIFWLQAAFHLASSIGLFAFYHPPRRSDYGKMTLRDITWACDPIGSGCFIGSATLLLLALDWAGGAYAWSDPHVAAPLAIGLGLLVAFCLYEWKGRSDGMAAHVFFQGSPNFALSVFAFAIEGWIFYSAVNSVTPQIVLNLGFEDNSWSISIRQLAYTVPTLLFSIPITYYATKRKDLRGPLLATFACFLIVSILYCVIAPTPSWSKAQYAINLLAGFGQSGPLTLLVALVQFAAPHAFLSTATGLAFSARAIGGAFGSAVLTAIINGYLASHLGPAVAGAVGSAAGPSELEGIVVGLASGNASVLLGLQPGTAAQVVSAVQYTHAAAYHRAWAAVVPFVVLALVCIWFVKDVAALMTEKVEACVEKTAVEGLGKDLEN